MPKEEPPYAISPARVAISHGPHLVDEENAPTTLERVLLRAAAHAQTEDIVYIEEERATRTQSYAQLLSEALRVLTGLQQLGLQPQDKVILQLNTCRHLITAFWSCQLGGLVPVPLPIPPTYSQARQKLLQTSHLLHHPLILTNAALAPEIQRLQQSAESVQIATIEQLMSNEPGTPYQGSQPGDLALLVLTSGSTGSAKAVILSHKNMLSQVRGVIQQKSLTREDVSFNWMPLDHVGTLCTHIRDVHLGSQQIQALPQTILQEPLHWLDWLSTYRVSTTRAPNFAFKLVNDRLLAAKPHAQWDISALRFIINAGEAIVAKVARHFLVLLQPYGLAPTAMHPCWGMSETSSGISYSETFALATDNDYTYVDLGRPLPGMSMRIVDEQNSLLPENTIGQLQVTGPTISSGYYANSQANQEAFLDDGWFSTGDLGFLHDGSLTLTGRAKDVIIVNGLNYACYEIEALVEDLAGIEPSFTALCSIHDRPGADDLLILFFSTAPTFPPEHLPSLLYTIRQHVSRHMGITLHYLVALPKELIPKTTLGKIQRRQLAQQFTTGTFASYTNVSASFSSSVQSEKQVPGTRMEALLVSIWQQLFGHESIAVNDDFFALGGNSLLAIQLVAAIYESTHIEFPIYKLFEHPTILELAAYIAQTSDTDNRIQLPPIQPAPRTEELPQSYAQQRLWFLTQWHPESPFYNIYAALRLRGSLDLSALEQALQSITQRHEILRTTFAESASEKLVQRIAPQATLAITRIDISLLPSYEQEAEAQQLLQAETRHAFDLVHGPLVRYLLLQASAQEHFLLVTMHHSISDGWSMSIFWRELMSYYNSILQEIPLTLPELRIQYADFACWQLQLVQQGRLHEQLVYWQSRLAGAPAVLKFPVDFPRPDIQTFQGARQSFSLSASCTASVKELSQHEGVTLFMTLLAAFQTLLYRYTGQDDIVIGTPIANRQQKDTQYVMGPFVNPLALRTDLSGNPSFTTFLHRVAASAIEAYQHQDLPFEVLVEELHPQRNPQSAPIFQIMFALQGMQTHELHLTGLETSFLELDPGIAKLDMTLFMTESAQGLVGTLEYNSDLFQNSTIMRLLSHFQSLLINMLAHPQQKLQEISLLSAKEHYLLTTEWNATATSYPHNKSVHQLFAEQAERTPEKVALVAGAEQWTYRQLNERANQLARYLQQAGVGPERFVALCMERSCAMILAILAILKAGGAYLPLDVNYPKARLHFMLTDLQAELVITQQHSVEYLPADGPKLLCIEAIQEHLAHYPCSNFSTQVQGEQLAYAMFTSGSSGTPKAVGIAHHSIIRLVKETHYVSFDESEVFLQLAPISFDAATFEIWGALLNGCTLVLAPPQQLSLVELSQCVQQQQITTLWLTAGLFHQLVEEQLPAFHMLRQLLAGGDVLSPRHVRMVRSAYPACRLINGYGPTENTTFTCTYDIGAHEPFRASVPIGTPIANTRVYILDALLHPVPVGVAGDLYIAGDGLARGYINRPALTAEKFIPDPFSTSPGQRLYITGDRTRYLSDGTIEFLGRADGQVKLRGFRIEPGEIERILTDYPTIQDAIVIACEDTPGDKRLIAYIIQQDQNQDFSLAALQAYLHEKLPGYMIPSAFMLIESFPLTSNGKVDRRMLPVPNPSAMVRDEEHVPPHTPVEQVIADIWTVLLGIQPGSIYDDFFLLGGHSLLATRLISRLNKVFHVNLPFQDLFAAPTIHGIATYLLAHETTTGRMTKIATLRQKLDAMSADDIHVLLQSRKQQANLDTH